MFAINALRRSLRQRRERSPLGPLLERYGIRARRDRRTPDLMPDQHR